MIKDLDLVNVRDHPSSVMRREVVTSNIDKLLNAIKDRVHTGEVFEDGPTTQADAERFETVEDLLRAAYKKSLELQ